MIFIKLRQANALYQRINDVNCYLLLVFITAQTCNVLEFAALYFSAYCP